MADLCDDLLLEIIARLPLKYAVQCSTLNKAFFHYISHPSFLRRNAELSSSRPTNVTIFHCSALRPKIFTKLTLGTEVAKSSVILPAEISVLGSCNGVLLLCDKSFQRYYVFNPITGGISFVDPMIGPHDDVGLVVDLETSSSSGQYYCFKLVGLDIDRRPRSQYSVLRFTVVAPPAGGDGTPMRLISRVEFVCESFTLMVDHNIRPVYAHGCVYWLGEEGRKVVAFNVEKEEARIMDGPVKGNGNGLFQSGVGKWFGVAEGSLSFVYTLPEEILVHAHDCDKDEWQIRYKIANICNLINNDYGNGTPLFFDGRRLFLQLRRRGEDGEVHMVDMSSGKAEKRGAVAGWADGYQLFVPFFPTLAKVSDVYLHNTDRIEMKESFLGLHRLLTDHPNHVRQSR